MSRREPDADAVERSEFSAARPNGERIDLGTVLLAAKLEAGARPCPAGKAVGDRSRYQTARMRGGGKRRPRQRCQAGHRELIVLPARIRKVLRPRIAGRNVPQLERRRP